MSGGGGVGWVEISLVKGNLYPSGLVGCYLKQDILI